MTDPIVLPNQIENDSAVLELDDKIKKCSDELTGLINECAVIKESRATVIKIMKEINSPANLLDDADKLHDSQISACETRIAAKKDQLDSLKLRRGDTIETLSKSTRTQIRWIFPDELKNTPFYDLAMNDIPPDMMEKILRRSNYFLLLERFSDKEPIAFMAVNAKRDDVIQIIATCAATDDVKYPAQLLVKELISSGWIPELRVEFSEDLPKNMVHHSEVYGCSAVEVVMKFDDFIQNYHQDN